MQLYFFFSRSNNSLCCLNNFGNFSRHKPPLILTCRNLEAEREKERERGGGGGGGGGGRKRDGGRGEI